MALTNKEREAINKCLLAIAQEIPRKVLNDHIFKGGPHLSLVNIGGANQVTTVRLNDVLDEMRKMIKVLKEESNEGQNISR